MSEILIVSGDGFESQELYYPLFRLNAEDDVSATVAASESGTIKGEVHDIVDDWSTYIVRRGYNAEAEVAFADIDPADYDGLVIPGGRAPESIRYDSDLQHIVQHFFDEEKPVAVTCHGPQVLSESGVLEGREITCWPTMRADFEQAGAEYQDETVVVDNNLVSAPSWAENGVWMERYIELLNN
ncbi:DJ-1/PfpI/YhbO family deglycase/protease [Halobellus sp. Atlit-38R]|uniref:DJ-1/PfpI/YhbO family deglycase/protease n=2 Tax=Haloferacaceae TaxID=1644056 RepID=UPI000EF198C7|nr:DJ-1/PfpI/YhbO family deglycase/protease [Halobellus sp. Atlit-38R]RLM83602.1 DJ-1/PfpI/YhbO family deglycase/protease [Halobellus sp. Atlit-38R]